MNRWAVILFLFITCLAKTGKSQDPQFSQFIYAPVYLNPALVAETRLWRFTLNTRLQWMKSPAQYVSNALTAEYSMAAANSGFGLQFLHDQAGTGKLTYVSIGGIYAYKASLNRRLKLNLGLRASYNQRYFDRSKLQFASDIAESDGGFANSFLDDRKSYFDVGAGAAIVARRWWAGISFDHLTQPEYSFSNAGTKLPLKYSVHVQYEFPIKRERRKGIVKGVTAAAQYKGQEQWDQVEIGGFYKHYGFSAGLFYRGVPVQRTVPDNFNHDAVIVLVGYQWLGLQINYSYDVTISKARGSTGGTHEFSIITHYPFHPKKRLRSHRFIRCPKF